MFGIPSVATYFAGVKSYLESKPFSMKQLFLPILLLAACSLNAQLFTDDFEAYETGDSISLVSEVDPWVLWSNLDTEEAYVSDEVAQSGTKSLKLEGASAAGGPQDIVLVAGLEGQYEVTFSLFVPEGNSGYYNVQENQVQGTTWAFETTLGSDGTISFNFDGTILLAGQYESNSWVTITHYIDTDSDLMHVYLNGEFLGQAPYDGGQVGGVNFYAAGDTQTLPLYYLDDVIVDIADPVVDAVAKLPQVECTFGPNPASNQIRLQANLDQASVRIMGLDGKVVLQEVRNDLMNGADLSFDLRNGVYLVEISNGTSRSTQRLVVQK